MRIEKILLSLTFGFVLLFAGTSVSHAQEVFPQPEAPYSQVKETRGVMLYPNPTEDFLKVSLEDLDLQDPTFEVYSIIGNNLQLDYELNPNGTYSIDVRGIRPGYYILIVRDRGSLFKQAMRFRKQEM
ncbi:T9SS type A sorting domain-containing protein [Roseivirga sp. BDSF3-8]|uniref:T9SS type A sorting domain-containing protein n=1 Tax=Roseivirga sp. BDSF3-8 TaxID=3241598 RepID=UPI003531F57B